MWSHFKSLRAHGPRFSLASLHKPACTAAPRAFLFLAGARLLASWLAAAGIALSLCAVPAGATTLLPIGAVVHDVPLRGLNGPSRTLSAYKGQVLLVNLWASWCGPCRAEMGSLERLAWQEQARAAGPRFTVIGISTDDYEAAAKNYLRAANVTINQYLDTDLRAEKMLGADRLPLTVLIGADGKVLGRHYGARDWDGAEAMQWITQRLKPGYQAYP